jgi:hypothetical protein
MSDRSDARELYMITHNTEQEKHTSMLSAGFKPTVPPSERPRTHAVDCAATGTGISYK